MKILILSDIHANIYALNTVLKTETYEQIYCAGDLVGYYANPNEVIDICKSQNIKSVKGNHDVAAYDLNAASSFNDYALISIEWTNKVLSNENKDYLKQLPYIIEEKDFTVFHGTLSEPESFKYYLAKASIAINLLHIKTRFMISGHSHVPAFLEYPEKFKMQEVFKVKPIDIEYHKEYILNPTSQYYINPGSIGQPRNKVVGGVYVVYDSDKDSIMFKTFEYDMSPILGDVVNNGLPIMNYKRLLLGI